MTVAGVNLLAVLLAGAVGFGVGGIWYGILGKRWMAAAGLTEAQVRGGSGGMPLGPMIRAVVGDLIIAAMLAGIMERYGDGTVTVAVGLLTAALIWFGFVLTTLAVNHGYGLKPLFLTVIDGGHWLAAMLAMGAVIGAFG